MKDKDIEDLVASYIGSQRKPKPIKFSDNLTKDQLLTLRRLLLDYKAHNKKKWKDYLLDLNIQHVLYYVDKDIEE
jgi:hypothetical protein